MKYLILILIITSNLYASDFFKGKTSLDSPFELRDPFDQPREKEDLEEPKKYQETKSGSYTNLPGVEKFRTIDIDKMTLTGIIFGKERRAFVKIYKDKNSYVLKEGTIIGKNGAELKAILPNGIVLVEKMINVYGEEEYLETVIPITR